MISARQYKLLKLMEECTEVAKRASKQMQFGDTQHQNGYEENGERLRVEILDFLMWSHLLAEGGHIRPIWFSDLQAHYENKFGRIMESLDEAISHGCVEPTTRHTFPEHL